MYVPINEYYFTLGFLISVKSARQATYSGHCERPASDQQKRKRWHRVGVIRRLRAADLPATVLLLQQPAQLGLDAVL